MKQPQKQHVFQRSPGGLHEFDENRHSENIFHQICAHTHYDQYFEVHVHLRKYHYSFRLL